jgi:hypothetical protein
MTFHFSGKLNQPIVLVWGTENPHVTLKDGRDAQNFVVCSFKGKGLWIPINTITGNSYFDMLAWPLPQSFYKMECLLASIWLLRTTWTHFAWRWIIWAGVTDVWCRWMPRSPDLAPCNFLFGWLHRRHSVCAESARVEAVIHKCYACHH